MATYFMFGKYSLEGMKGISAGRTSKTLALIKKHGGEFKAGYALLGDVDQRITYRIWELLVAAKLPSLIALASRGLSV